MPAVIVQAGALGDVIRMGVVDEVLYLFAVFLLILSLIFIVDLGLDIEKGIASVAAALSAMALGKSRQ